MNKSCNKCGVKLEPGVNITPSRFKNWDYTCKDCLKEYNRLASIKYQDKLKNNPNYIPNFITKTPAGVYGIFILGQLVYIGESSIPYARKQLHLHHTMKKVTNLAPLKGKLITKDEIEFVILEYINNTKQRLKKEKYYINTLKPVLNFD